MAASNQFLKITERGVNAQLRTVIEDSISRAWPTAVGLRTTSDQAGESYAWLGHTPQMREWVGKRKANGLLENEYFLRNKKFENTIQIALDDLRRDKTGQVQQKIASLGRRAVSHWAELTTDAIVDNGTCYDGQNFFSASHSEGDSGTQSNLLTASDIPSLAVADRDAPTAEEMATILMDVANHFYTLNDDQGEALNEDLSDILVMVPTDLRPVTLKALRADSLATSAGAAVDNILMADDLNYTVRHNNRLTSAYELYFFRANGDQRPFILQEESAPMAQIKGEDSEFAFDHDAIQVGLKALRNVGYGFWQTAIKATISTA